MPQNEGLSSLVLDLQREYNSVKINPLEIKEKAISLLKAVLAQDKIESKQAELVSRSIREASEALYKLKGEKAPLLNELRTIRAASLEYILMNSNGIDNQTKAWLYFDLSSTYRWLRSNPLEEEVKDVFSLCELSTLDELIDILLKEDINKASVQQKIGFIDKEYSSLLEDNLHVPKNFRDALRESFSVIENNKLRERIINRRLISIKYVLKNGKGNLKTKLRYLKDKYHRKEEYNFKNIRSVSDLEYIADRLEFRMKRVREKPNTFKAINLSKDMDRFMLYIKKVDYEQIAYILEKFFPTAINFYEDTLNKRVYKPWRKRGFCLLDLSKAYSMYSLLFNLESYNDTTKKDTLYFASMTPYSELLDLLIINFESRGTLEDISLNHLKKGIFSIKEWNPPEYEMAEKILKEVGVESRFAKKRAEMIVETSLGDLKEKVKEYERVYKQATH